MATPVTVDNIIDVSQGSALPTIVAFDKVAIPSTSTVDAGAPSGGGGGGGSTRPSTGMLYPRYS